MNRMPMIPRAVLALFASVVVLSGLQAAPLTESLKPGKVALKSVGPIAFGADGVIFVGDPKAASIYAINTNDAKPVPAASVTLEGLSNKLAALLGVKADDVNIADLAVNPVSNRVYLSVGRGKGPDAIPVLFRIEGNEPKEVSLDNVPHAVVELSKPVAGTKRQEAITGLKVVKDKLYVAGLSNEEFASTLRVIPLPFDGKATSASIQIYHGAHGKFETAAPVRTFAPIEVNGKEEILAAYTCTPLVRIPVADLKDGAKVKGTTVAELGNRNRPLDIIIYKKGDKQYALMANSARGVMVVDLQGLEKVEAIVEKVKETAGLKYDTLKELTGVEHLDKLGDSQAVLLIRDKDGLSLKTINLP